MNTIEIDDQVYEELSGRAVGFNITANDVLRRLLNLAPPSRTQPMSIVSNGAPQSTASTPATILEYVRGERFRRHYQAVDKFLAILGWLHQAHPERFSEVALAFRRGTRRYFAKSEREVVQSGDGITAKSIPESKFWVLTTLDNKSKRIVVEDMMRALGYSRSDINVVVAELPDSGIRRSHARSRLLATL